jgi:hypothetical protein
MVRFVLLAAAILIVGVLCAMLWQHQRYLEARREIVHDLQPLLHSADVFHVVTFLELRPGADLLESLRKLRDEIESGGEARMVYAGKVAVNARPSDQLIEAFGGEVPWDAVIAVQYPSREAWDRVAASEDHRRALSAFARTYAHGMRRWPWVNLGIPQVLLAMRVRQILTGAPSHFPFVPAQSADADGQRQALTERLRSQREHGMHAVIVVNLLKRGTPEQEAANSAYTGRMFELMAEGGHGPMNIGDAVTLERGTDYDTVALVYYPGVDYFADMATSTFYQGIYGQKQVGDTQASITVPVLDRL